VAALALELLDAPGHPERDALHLHRQLARLNEAALMIDARLGDSGAVADGAAVQLLHQRLFDAGAYTLIASVESHRPAASTIIVPPPGNDSATEVNVPLAAAAGPARTVVSTRPVPDGRHRRGRPLRSAQRSTGRIRRLRAAWSRVRVRACHSQPMK